MLTFGLLLFVGIIGAYGIDPGSIIGLPKTKVNGVDGKLVHQMENVEIEDESIDTFHRESKHLEHVNLQNFITSNDNVEIVKSDKSTSRLIEFDIDANNTNFRAGMWAMAIVTVLATVIPAYFMETDFGIHRTLQYVLPSRNPWQSVTNTYDRVTSTYNLMGVADGMSSSLHSVLEALDNIAEKYGDNEIL